MLPIFKDASGLILKRSILTNTIIYYTGQFYYDILVNDNLDTLLSTGQSKNVSRWFNFLAKQNSFKQCSEKLKLPSKKPKVLFGNNYDMHSYARKTSKKCFKQ